MSERLVWEIIERDWETIELGSDSSLVPIKWMTIAEIRDLYGPPIDEVPDAAPDG